MGGMHSFVARYVCLRMTIQTATTAILWISNYCYLNMKFDNAFRICGGTWEFCDGSCYMCLKAKTRSTNTTDDIRYDDIISKAQELLYESYE